MNKKSKSGDGVFRALDKLQKAVLKPAVPFKFKEGKNIDTPSGFTNGERAERGQASCMIHPDWKSNDWETAVNDALSDIFHFCDQQGVNVEKVIKYAKANWQAER